MRNIKLIIEYDGANYNGWQMQRVKTKDSKFKNRTIQETIEKVIREILKEDIKLIVSGRTDSGAHALAQVANFKTNSRLKPNQIKNALNANLPSDIVIRDAMEIDLRFHSRFDVKSKVYRYIVLNRPVPSAIDRNRCLFFPYRLNLALIRKEAKFFIGRHNFKAFQTSNNNAEKTAVRTVKKLDITKKGDFIIFDIEADGFLYKMVRNMVGTLLEIGRGRFGKGTIKRLLKTKDRRLAGPAVPAKGLYLLEVNY
jgi:tRNA pseudouridine38-40 synthase